MRALLDTNIFLEIVLSQERAEEAKELLMKSTQHEFFITDYSLHSIGLLLFRKKQHEAFRAFIEDVLLNGGIGLLSLYSNEMETVNHKFQQNQEFWAMGEIERPEGFEPSGCSISCYFTNF